MPPKSKTPPNQPTPPKNMLDWMGVSATPYWRVARPLGGAFSLLVALFFVAALIATGAVLVRTIFISTGPNLGAGALIAAILGAPFLIWGTVIKQTSLTFQKEGHITDRISKAVEQLGAEKTVKKLNDNGQTVETSEPNIEVRIGGLLSLERISQDSLHYDKGRDHVRVMEILCAYVRENSNARPPQISLRSNYFNSESDDFAKPDYGESTITDADFKALKGIGADDDIIEHIGIKALRRWTQSLPSLRTDTQQALDIIGRRDANPNAIKRETEDNYHLELTGANLQGANLSNAFLSGAILIQARLEGAYLFNTRLEGATLLAARMDGARCYRTKMEGANLRVARFEGAEFLKTTFDETTSLGATVLNGATVRDVDNTTIVQLAPYLNAMFGDASVELPDHITRPAHWPDWELPFSSENGFRTQWQKWLSDPATYTPPPPPENPPADHPAD